MRTEVGIYDHTRCKAPLSFRGHCHLLWGLHECGLSRFHLHMVHVWHCIVQVFNACVMISGTSLLFSSDMSGQFCVEKGFEENCLGEECCVPSTPCWVFAPQHCSPALNKPLSSATPGFGKSCLYCYNSGGFFLISTNTHIHTS